MGGNGKQERTERPQACSKAFVVAVALVGAGLGYAVGLCEAAHAYFFPQPRVLLQVDVSYVIWFLAPLVDTVVFGGLGLALGLVFAGLKSVRHTWKAALLAGTLAAAGAYLVTALLPKDVTTGARVTLGLPTLWESLAGIFIFTFLILKTYGSAWDFVAWAERRPTAHYAQVLVAATLVAAAGMGFYLIHHPKSGIPGAPVLRTSTGNPNIVLITLDTVRADHLSAYGYPRPTTPNLSRFASRGVLFENAIASTSWTLASHASIFTGLLEHQHGADSYIPLTPGLCTLAEILESRGYQTAGFTANSYYMLSGWGVGKGFELYDDDSFSLRHNLQATLPGRTVVSSLYWHLIRHDVFDRRSAAQLNRDIYLWFGKRPGRPYFLFVNYFDAHLPYLAPPPYDTRFGKIYEDVFRNVSFINASTLPRPLSPDEEVSLVAGYDNCLAYLDDQVGQLLQFLANRPESSNTIIIITSDHGEGLGEHGKIEHGLNLYREALRVPLMIVGPRIPSSQRIAHVASLRELFPTVLDLALRGEAPFSRTSLRRFWTAGYHPQPTDDPVISELIPNTDEPLPAVVSLMTPEWHYLHNSQGEAELYHWPADPEEKLNLSTNPQYSEVLESLYRRLFEQAAYSVRPWLGLKYLTALDRRGYSALPDLALVRGLPPNWVPPELRIGSLQAYLSLARVRRTEQPSPPDQELLKSLPYH